jgi:branched-chain amino acid transport system permease protein
MPAEQMLIQTFVNGVMSALILILIASGLCLVFGIMRIVNFAHGEFYMLGGFGAWILFAEKLLPQAGGPTVHYILAIILSMVAVGILGVLVERFLFRPFVGNMELTMIVSFGVMLILQAASLVSFGVRDKSFGSPFSGSIHMGGISLSEERMAVVICGVIFIAAMYLFIQRTKLGKAMRAVAQDMEAASVQGISINLCFTLAMGIACALAALGGALMGPIFYVNPYMGVEPIMKAFVVVILGGMGSLPGAVIGGFIVGMGESFVTTYVGAHLAMMVVFLVMIGVFLFKPAGILGHEE